MAELLHTYLPELPAGEIWDRLNQKILGEAARADKAGGDGVEVAPPCGYDPALDSEGRFRDYVAHHVQVWADRVESAVAASPVVAPENTLVRDFLSGQTDAAADLMTRTLLDELHRRRATGLLVGDTPEARYQSFRAWTNSAAGHAEMLERNAGLFRAVRDRVRAAESYLLHLIGEVELTRDRLASCIPDVGEHSLITAIGLGEGDTHNGGKTAARISFSNGSRVLYKPHPIEAEVGYHAFVRWMNERMGTSLRTINAVPTSEGGFVEYVRTEEFAGEAEEYFAHIGRLAGILYLLKATDIHYENVVTCADGPVVVDTETLLTPRLRRTLADGDRSAAHTAATFIRESVAGIGVLPMVVKSSDSDLGMDIGAIGYDPGQQIPYRTFALRNPGRDDMFVELAEVKTASVNANLSVFAATGLPVPTQREIIKTELRRILEYARSHSDEVMGAIEKHLGDAPFRYVNIPTVFYTQLLRMATHPAALRDPLVRSAVLNRVVLRTGDAHELADEEARQLAAWDVPYFEYVARSTTLFSRTDHRAKGAGEERAVCADAFEEPALETVRARITGISPETIDRELRMVDLAFVNKLPVERETTGFVPVLPIGTTPANVPRKRMLDEAVRIGDALVATMVESADSAFPATWIAPQVMTAEQSQWSPGTLGYDLYGGSPGLALVLAGLARETGDSVYADAAVRVLGPLENQLRRGALEGPKISVGGMTGLAGTVYAITTARRLLGTRGTMTAGELACELARRAEPDVGCDFVSGMAGTLAVCLVLHRAAEDGADRSLVEDAARSIAATEAAILKGLRTDYGRITPYTGYAHGAMGIAPVLVEYGTVLGDAYVRDLGLGVLSDVLGAYEESDRDWPREWGGADRSYGWCHGAPGLLLGALTTVRHAPDAIPRGRLERLAELTLQRGFGNNPTYCHGDLASAEITAMAERELPGLFGGRLGTDLYPRLFTDVVERYGERADTKYAYSSSLLVGRAGFAWSILRHLDPDTYPCVLSLE
ncbi:type 2 lanthipeptide synthetase LanM family protein [Streptomyces angustmyceticus]|uniref:type 2 lanthipeptide synthetase LanM family protein n=1 Tax=Streptomyces angustmyceticus TaxID=285578 RepID=UPI0036BE7480